MKPEELIKICKCGETSYVQFKQQFSTQKQIAEEMVAFANSKGGMIVFGVEDKTGNLVGMDYATIQNTSREVGNAANEQIRPTLYIQTEVVLIEEKAFLLVHIEEGKNKPYKDLSGHIWVKQGADKRRITENAEILSLFQESGSYYPDKMPVRNSTIRDLDNYKIDGYIYKLTGKALHEFGSNKERILRNLSILAEDNTPTMAGLLFFAHQPQDFYPSFVVKAVSFFGNDLSGSKYRNSKELTGTLAELYEKSMDFFKSNLFSVQNNQSFNSIGELEIPVDALEEALQNALIHRDYIRTAPIRILIFDNRVEIISPGALAGGMSVEMIEEGNTFQRNPLISKIGSNIMRYRGLGSGIIRILSKCPDVTFISEDFNFRVIFPRKLQIHAENGEVTQKQDTDIYKSGEHFHEYTPKNNKNDEENWCTGEVNDNKYNRHAINGEVNKTKANGSPIIGEASNIDWQEKLAVIRQIDKEKKLKINDKKLCILKLLYENPHITHSAISQTTQIPLRTVERIISGMRDKVITRQGSDKTGIWVFIV